MVSAREALNKKNLIDNKANPHVFWALDSQVKYYCSALQNLPIRSSFTAWSSGVTVDLLQENIILHRELRNIKKKLAEIEQKIPEQKTIVLREISSDEAKEEIKSLFLDGKTHYYSDIAEQLQLDLKAVVEICHELEDSGEITVDD